MKRSDIHIPVCMIGESESTLELYRDLILAGESPGIASILSTRQAPGLETDTNHFVGLRSIGEVAGIDYEAGVYKQARKAGIHVNEHSRYNPSLADERRGGDPGAWIHNGEGVDKWRKVALERGHNSEDLRVKGDGRIGELEAKREARINRKNARLKEREEMVSDRKKKAGIPE